VRNVTESGSSRIRRILGGWSANSMIVLLALTQQIVLIPFFLRYLGHETLSAWLTIFAAGSLVQAADPGLHAWSLNRFLSFKSRGDTDRRTRRYFAGVLLLFIGVVAGLIAIVGILLMLVSPAAVLGFRNEPGFNLTFAIVTLGLATTLPVNLASSLFRARGLYGRVVAVQAWGTGVGQLAQVIAVLLTGNLLVLALAFVAGQVGVSAFILFSDLRRQFPFLSGLPRRVSWRWARAQFAGAFPFGVMNFAEVGMSYLSVLLVGALVSDRAAIAQWVLTRTVANFLRGLCYQFSLPIAAELGHDHAVGARDSLRALYARGLFIVTFTVSLITGGLLSFWHEFFELWTAGAIPYDATLAIVLIGGTCLVTPATFAMSYASYSDRGTLLLWTKSLQIAIFFGLAVFLIPALGPLGAAISLTSGDTVGQLGVLFSLLLVQTLQHPFRHAVLLFGMMLVVVAAGLGMGMLARYVVPTTGFIGLVLQCTVWLAGMALICSPLARSGIRNKLIASIPH
jgi:O-antigen/teichoic acid export membrane protein